MRGPKDQLLTLALLSGVVCAPVTVAALLLAGPAPPPPNAVSPVILVQAPRAGAGGEAAPAAPPRPSNAPASGGAPANPLALGMLYVTGTARIIGGAGSVPMVGGRYLYLGGEIISIGKGSMGVLRLGNRDAIYVCPASTARVVRREGRYRLTLDRGLVRFRFGPRTGFRVRVGDATLAPVTDGAGPPDEPGATAHEAEVLAGEDRKWLVWEISGRLRVARGSVEIGIARAGEILGWGEAPDQGKPAAPRSFAGQRVTVPRSLLANLEPAAGASGGALPYLCRGREVADFAAVAALRATAAGPGTPPVTPPVPIPETGGTNSGATELSQLPPTGAGLPAPAPASAIFTASPIAPTSTGGVVASPS